MQSGQPLKKLTTMIVWQQENITQEDKIKCKEAGQQESMTTEKIQYMKTKPNAKWEAVEKVGRFNSMATRKND